MAPALLNQDQIAAELASLPGWKLREGSISRAVEFDDFREAFAFMSYAALVSESLDHHPDWHNVYNRLTITLSTHEAGGVTARDIKWARAVQGKLPASAA